MARGVCGRGGGGVAVGGSALTSCLNESLASAPIDASLCVMRLPTVFAVALFAAILPTPVAASEFKPALRYEVRRNLGTDLVFTMLLRDRRMGARATANAETRICIKEPLTQACGEKLIGAAHTLARAGDLEGAETTARAAITVMTRIHGAEHAETRAATSMLGTVLIDAGRYREAEEVLRALLQAMQGRGETDTEPFADHAMNLAIVLAEQRGFVESEALFRSAVAVRERHAAARPLDLATARANLAVLLHRTGRYAEALAEHRAALTLRQRHHADRYDIGTSMLNLAETAARMPGAGPFLAEAHFLQASLELDFGLSLGDPRRTAAHIEYAAFLDATGRSGEARKRLERAYLEARRIDDPASPVRIRTSWALGASLATTQRDRPKARVLLRDAGRGALDRVARAREFDERTRTDLDRYRGIFTGSVKLSWMLADKRR